MINPISVCIIAKNEEHRIERCLSSIKPYGFEIVVVDTGSTDHTKSIAGNYADKLLDFTWCDDFSAARNFSLRSASNNWIFMMDCDEWIKEIDVEEMTYFRKHLSDSVGSVFRENLVTRNGSQVLDNTDYTERFFDKRLFHYTGVIHEQLTPIRGKDITSYLLKTTLLHTGYDMSPEERLAKNNRNYSLLLKQLKAEPDNPYLYYQLGKTSEITGNFEKACEYYDIALRYDLDPELAYVQALVVSYGNALLLTGQHQKALGFEGIYSEFSSLADFVYLMGNIYKANGMYEEATDEYQKALNIPLCRQNGANSFLPMYQTGYMFAELGDYETAADCYRQCGAYKPAQDALLSITHLLKN